MYKAIMLVVSFLSLLLPVCSVRAYVYFVEAENFDPDNSEPMVGGAVWNVVDNKDAFNKKYLDYSGPHAGAITSLLYPIPNVSDAAGQWRVWVKCIMPDGGFDSYFFYVSNDGGDKWGPQQAAHGSGIWQDWKWEGWTLNTPLEKGDENVLRIAERENARADVICIRNDGMMPTDEEYEKWQEENKEGKISVEPLRKLTTTWGSAKSAY